MTADIIFSPSFPTLFSFLIKTQHAQLENELRAENEESANVEKKLEEAEEEVVVAAAGDAPDPCSQLKCKDGTAIKTCENLKQI